MGSYLAGFRVFSRPALPPRQAFRPWVCLSGRDLSPSVGPRGARPPAAHLPSAADSAPHLSGTASRRRRPSALLPVSPSGPAASLRLPKSACVTRSVPSGRLGYLGGFRAPARVSVCLSFCPTRRVQPAGPTLQVPGAPFRGRRARAAAFASWEPAGNRPSGRRRNPRSAPALVAVILSQEEVEAYIYAENGSRGLDLQW